MKVALETLEDMYLACCKREILECLRLQVHKISRAPYIWCAGPHKNKTILMINIVWCTREVDSLLTCNCWGVLNHLFTTLINCCSFDLFCHTTLFSLSSNLKLIVKTSLWKLSIFSSCKQLLSSCSYSRLIFLLPCVVLVVIFIWSTISYSNGFC